MALQLSRTLRGLFVRPKATAPDAPFDAEAAIARYLAQRDRRTDEPLGRETH